MTLSHEKTPSFDTAAEPERVADTRDLALFEAALLLDASQRPEIETKSPFHPITEWGPTHHRDDYSAPELPTNEGLTYSA